MMPEIITQHIVGRGGDYWIAYSNGKHFDPYKNIKKFGYGKTRKESLDNMGAPLQGKKCVKKS
jgi:hypothetical protein